MQASLAVAGYGRKQSCGESSRGSGLDLGACMRRLWGSKEAVVTGEMKSRKRGENKVPVSWSRGGQIDSLKGQM